MEKLTIIGGGLAGCEAALAAAKAGISVRLFEMKPSKYSPAHKSQYLAELVCSNSLGSEGENSASSLLKEEMKILGSVVIEAANAARVPAGQALAVERDVFSGAITSKIVYNPLIEIVREEITSIPNEGRVILASGPLTSDSLADDIARRVGSPHLHFYDAVSPIIVADSIDMNIAWKASRYGKGGDDYINLPLDEAEYRRFISELLAGEVFPYHDFEKSNVFEGCMPIEEMASRGLETLAHGPMKPVGLEDPRTGRRPYAVVQLRAEDREGTLYNIVGFQTKLKHGEQERVFRMLPGLANAEFARLGSLHRNTYIDAPKTVNRRGEFKSDARVIVAGQLVGVEGYLESSASGIIAGLIAAANIKGVDIDVPPTTTVIGAMLHRIDNHTGKNYAPMNANWGILPPPEIKIRKHERKAYARERSLKAIAGYAESIKTRLF